MSAYGKKNIQEFLQNMYLENKILAVHKEKIDKCFVTQSNIGRPLPKFEAFTNYDDSIAYSTVNVKYSLKNFEKNNYENNQKNYIKEISDRLEQGITELCSGRELAELKNSLETIRTTAAEIINSIDGHFAELQKQQETEKEREAEKVYAGGQERSADRAAGHAAQTEQCKDKGSWAAMIANRKVAVSEKESNATVREQKPDVLLNEKTDFPFLRSNNEEMKLTEQQIHKISLNEKENDLFREQLNKYFNNQMLTHEVINVCSTPNILKILNSSAKRIILSQSDLENAISDASSGKKKYTTLSFHPFI